MISDLTSQLAAANFVCTTAEMWSACHNSDKFNFPAFEQWYTKLVTGQPVKNKVDRHTDRQTDRQALK